jgi:internalin A
MHNLAWWNTLSPEWQQIFFNNVNVLSSSPQFFTSIDALKKIHFSSKEITDLAPVAGLKNLEKLSFCFTSVTDLSPLCNLNNLTEIICESNGIVNLFGIPKNLIYLNCCGNKIADLSPLANLQHLEYLLAARNEISDLSPLSKLIKLKSLHCNGNPIKTYEPLKCLKGSLKSLTCTLIKGLTNNLYGVWLDETTEIIPK